MSSQCVKEKDHRNTGNTGEQYGKEIDKIFPGLCKIVGNCITDQGKTVTNKSDNRSSGYTGEALAGPDGSVVEDCA